jgi:hypothetical protein
MPKRRVRAHGLQDATKGNEANEASCVYKTLHGVGKHSLLLGWLKKPILPVRYLGKKHRCIRARSRHNQDSGRLDERQDHPVRLMESGRSVARLARLFRVQEVVSSNLTAPTNASEPSEVSVNPEPETFHLERFLLFEHPGATRKRKTLPMIGTRERDATWPMDGRSRWASLFAGP